MQENNFEKQVQQKMDELAIKPSAEVWEKLSITIAKDKKDRKILIILLLLLLLMSTTAYLIFYKNPGKEVGSVLVKKDSPGNIKNGDTTEIDRTANGRLSINDVSSAPGEMRANGKPNNFKDSIVTANAGHQQETVAASPNKNELIQRDNKSIKKVVVKNNSNMLAIHKGKKVKLTTNQKASIAIIPVNPEGLHDNKTAFADAVNLIKEGEIKNDKKNNETVEIQRMDSAEIIQPVNSVTGTIASLNKKVKASTTTQFIENKNIDADKKSIASSKRKNSWKFGLSFSAGVSTTKDGLLGVIGSGSGDESKAYDPLQNSSGGVNNGTSPVYAASPLKAGMGIVAGLFIQKNLSSKTSIIIGLNFKMLTSSIMTGSRVDSSAFYSSNSFRLSDFYYRNGSQATYKNHFNFIEIPVAIRVKLGKAKKSPIYLNTGASIAQLIGSNALQFDAATGQYFKDNHLLNKTQYGVSGGLLFSVNTNANHPFLIGPDVNFNLNKMAASGLYQNRHYSYIGVMLQKTF